MAGVSEEQGSTDAPARLGRAGVGVVAGGLLLGASSLLLPFASAAGLVLLVGAGGLVLGDTTDAIQGSVGVIAVGGVGIVESATGFGLGIGPELLAVLAIAFGAFDVLAGRLLSRLRSR